MQLFTSGIDFLKRQTRLTRFKQLKKLLPLLTILAMLMISLQSAKAQVSITNLNTAVSETFTIGSSATATLPTGFKIGPDWATGITATASALGTSGTGVVGSGSSGSSVNWANGVTATSTDRAVGFLNSGGYTSPRSITYAFVNNTGTTIESLDIAFDYEKYRSGTRAFVWNFFHGNTSGATTAATDGDQAYAADANNNIAANAPVTTSKAFTLNGLSIAAGTTYYLRWTFTGVGGSSNGQGIGIDNVSITPHAASLPPSLQASTNSITGLTYTLGTGASNASSAFSISGSNLTPATGFIKLTPSTNLEFYNGSWRASADSFSYTGGTVATGDNFQVRLTAGLPAGNYSEQLIISGGLAADTISVSGSVTTQGVPIVSASVETITGLTYIVGGGPSTPSPGFSLTGSDLLPEEGDINFSLAPEIEVYNGVAWQSGSFLVHYTGGAIDISELFEVRLKAGLPVGTYGPLPIYIDGPSSDVVMVYGSVTNPPPPALSVTPSSLSGLTYIAGSGPSAASAPFSITGSNLVPAAGNITLTPSANIEIFDGSTWHATAFAVAYSGGTISISNYTVRLKAGLAANTYSAESVGLSGGGTTANISVSGTVTAPDYISITSVGTAVIENFDGLATTGTSAVVPNGWAFAEVGTAPNTSYTAGTGIGTAGDTYSFGTGTDRAFGGLQSNAVTPTIGAKFRNFTGGNISTLTIAYKGEQWRLGTIGRVDRLDFQYSTDATSLTTGTWTDVNTLDFTAPVTTVVGNKDGNVAPNFTNISGQITGLSIADGSTIWIRWNDFSATGADDGLGVDDFSLTVPSPILTSTVTSINDLGYVEGAGPSNNPNNFGVSGSNLSPATGNVILTPSSNIEIYDGSAWQSAPVSIAYTGGAFAIGSTYSVRLKAGLSAGDYNSESVTVSGGGATAYIITVPGTVAAAGTPTLTSSTSNIVTPGYVEGAGPSAASATFSVSGNDLNPLNDNITFTPSANIEIFDGANWQSTAFDVAYTGGTVSTGLIYRVRLKAGLTAGTYNTELITIAGGSATTEIMVSGTVTQPPPPSLTASVATITGLTYAVGAGPSAPSAIFSFSGANLVPAEGDIMLTPSANVEIYDGATWHAAAFTVAYTAGTVSTNSVYQVRLKAGLAVGIYGSESVAIAGGGTTDGITVSGSVIVPDYIALTAFGTAATEDFNTLASTGTTNAVLPAGWSFVESGTGANATYAADNGGANGGNTYSYGATNATDRAFGSLQSGSVITTIGAKLLNNTGNPVSTLAIAYTGEEWRLGTTARIDRLDFQYSTNATSLTTGTWVDANTLDFSTPNTTGSAGARDGNTAPNFAAIAAQITGFTIANGGTLWIRWTNFDATSADDGLAIDDFSVTPLVTLPSWTSTAGDGNWSNPSNWSNSAVPTALTDASIPAGATPYPSVTGAAQVRDLNVAAGATLNISASAFTINGILTGTGTLSTGTGTTLTIAGTGAFGTLYFDQATDGSSNAVGQLILNRTGGTVSLGNKLVITNKLTPTAGVLTTGGLLHLRSTAAQTAAIGQGSTSGNYISGDVTVERYLSGPADGLNNRAWRMLSVPTMGSQSIHNAWQEGQAAGEVGTPGYGTNISSSAANWSTSGFDFQTLSGSLQTYNPVSNNYNYVSSTNTPIATTSGYFLYLRGDRTVSASAAVTGNTSTTLRSKGGLYQGDRPGIAVGANKFAMIGNIYASAIDFEKMRQDAVNSNTGLGGGLTSGNPNHTGTFYVWDPRLSNNGSLGGYQTFSSNSGYSAVPGGGSYGGSNSRVESGQAFFVYAAGTAGALTLKESYKEDGSNNVARPSAIPPQFRTNLYRTNTATPELADGNIAVFDSAYSNAVDGDDALKLPNFDENIAILRDNNNLVIEARQALTDTDTIYFNMWNMQPHGYKFSFVTLNWSAVGAGLTAFLQDNYLGTTTPINLAAATEVNFNVTNVAASSAATRFRVVFRQSAPVPVTFTSVVAAPKLSGIQVDWKVAGERGITQYIVERSADGRSFSGIGTVAAAGHTDYGFFDANPIAGTSFYRIKSIDASGSVKYTNIVKVVLGNLVPSFTITPNPIENNLLNVMFTNQVKGRYTIRMINNLGQSIYSRVAEHAGGTGLQSFVLPAGIVSGHYNVEIISPAKTTTVQKVLVNMTN